MTPEHGSAVDPAAVCAVVAHVLARPHVAPSDDFFALNGQSVQAMVLVARVAERWGVQLTLAELFDHPVIADLADIIDRRVLAS